MKRYFYFRDVAAIGDDDASNDSLLVPVENIRAFSLLNDTTVGVHYEAVTYDDGQTGSMQTERVDLTINAATGHKVIQALCEATNQGPHHDGIVTIADDVTSTYFNGDVTAVADIDNLALLANASA